MKSLGAILSFTAASAVAQMSMDPGMSMDPDMAMPPSMAMPPNMAMPPDMAMPPNMAMPGMMMPGTLSTTNTSSSTTCADVHLIVVRASTEPPSQGVIGIVATMISAANPGSTVEWIRYPALLTPYIASSTKGTMETTNRLITYADMCKNSKIVLLGYSQGAHVIGDVMCGGGEGSLGALSPPIMDTYSDRVVAVVQMGDPRHVVNKTYDMGTAMKNGLFPRPNDISCDRFAKKFISFCDMDDPFCSGGGDIAVHLTYTKRYTMAAVKFVQDKLGMAGSMMNAAPKNTFDLWSSMALTTFGAIMFLAFQ